MKLNIYTGAHNQSVIMIAESIGRQVMLCW